MIKFTCHKHGEVESAPNTNGRAYCPKCVAEGMQKALLPGSTVHVDKGRVSHVSLYVPLQVSRMKVGKDGEISFEHEEPFDPGPVEFVLAKDAAYVNVEPKDDEK